MDQPVGRRRLLVRALLLALVVMGVARWGTRSRVDQAATLPEGRTLTLQAVSFGTNHYGPPRWWNHLRANLPPTWLAALRVQRAPSLSTVEPSLVLFLRSRSREGSDISAGNWARREIAYYLADEEGFESPMTVSYLPSGWGKVGTDPEEVVLSTACFPRRSRQFRLRLYPTSAAGDPLPLADFAITRAPSADYPHWQAESLPATRREGDLEFTLTRLTVVPSTNPPGRAEVGRRAHVATAWFSVRWQGRPQAGWGIRAIRLTEATGNALMLFPSADPWGLRRTAAADGTLVCQFPWPFWSSEPAWKFQVEFGPESVSALSPEAHGTFRRVLVPPRDGLIHLDLRTNLSGMDCRVLALVGEHASLPGREHDVHEQTTLEVEVPYLPDDLRFDVLRVADDQQRTARAAMSIERRSYGFQIAADAKTVDITLAVYPRRSVAYHARPEFTRESR